MRWSALLLGLLWPCLDACSRRAEIADTPDGGALKPLPETPSDAGLIEIDAGTAMAPACLDREQADGCRGANDFPCNFLGWVNAVAQECQGLTNCQTNGVLGVDMGSDGCVSRIAMSEPSTAFAACLRERFDSARCQCGAQSAREFLGLGNAGCPDAAPVACGSAEFPCQLGQICVEGLCIANPDAGASP